MVDAVLGIMMMDVHVVGDMNNADSVVVVAVCEGRTWANAEWETLFPARVATGFIADAIAAMGRVDLDVTVKYLRA